VVELREQLSELEAKTGLPIVRTIATKSSENNTAEQTLRRIQGGFKPEEVLLSFHAGRESSAMWAVTQNGIELYRLPPASKLKDRIDRFRKAVAEKGPDRDSLGESLYQELFSGLDPTFQQKPVWIFSAEDSFFDIPMAALVAGKREGKPVYLIEQHAILHTPSAALLSAVPRPAPEGPFLGIGDGIYNTADRRWERDKAPAGKDAVVQLARLPGSAREIAACALAWDGAAAPITLTGRGATRAALFAALQKNPSIIHFAAHFLTTPKNPEEALIDLGLSASGDAESLHERDIIGLKVQDGLVTMSGCDSANSGSIPIAGVLGLTRAWLIAGARAVTGSRWPTPDDSGELFQSYYRHLRERSKNPARLRAAVLSLRDAQLAMLHSQSWRSDPSYWSAFYVLGKE